MLRALARLLSPGPGHPGDQADFSVGREVLRAGTRPVLGVCLGMQGLVTAYGGDGRAGRRPRTARWRGSTTTGGAYSRACRRGSRRCATTRSRRVDVPDELEVTGHRRGGGGDGGAAPRPAAGGRAVPPRVDPLRARRARWCANFLGRAHERGRRPGARSSPRSRPSTTACFWLDGGGAREWSGRRSIIGWLDERRRVADLRRRAPRGDPARRRALGAVVGDDVFAVLEDELAAGSESDQWFGYFGYAAAPRPARRAPGPGMPDAIWMRARARAAVRPRPAPGTPDLAGRERAIGPILADRPRPAVGVRRRVRAASRSTCTRATPTRST